MGDWAVGWDIGHLEVDDSSTPDNVTITASATAHTKGSYAELIASTSFDAAGLLIMYTAASADLSYLLDVAIGAAASEVIVVPDLLFCAEDRLTSWFFLPCEIPASTRIAARCQCSTGSSAMRVRAMPMSGGFYLPRSLGQVVTYGADSGSSGGTAIDAGASANTFPASYTQLVASTSEDLAALAINLGGNLNGSTADAAFEIEVAVGASSSEVVALNVVLYSGSATDVQGPEPGGFWFPCSIPSGSRLSARMRASTTDATDRVTDLVVHGLAV